LLLYVTLTRLRQLLGLRRLSAAVDAPFSDLASPPAGKLRKNQAIFFHPVQLPADAAIAGHAQSHCRPMVLSGLHKYRICEGRAAHASLTAWRSSPNTARPLQAAANVAPPAFRPGHGRRDAQLPKSPKDHALPGSRQLQAADAGRVFQKTFADITFINVEKN
jgi:hypothetical protein